MLDDPRRNGVRPRLNRRKLLQVGGVGMIGLGLPQLLASSAGRGGSGEEKSCIFIVQYRGAPHQDTLDLKPEAPVDIAGPYRPIATTVPGLQICEKLPRLAKLARHYSLIRSMTHGNAGHDGGMHVCMTGHSQPKPSTPYFGSVMPSYGHDRRGPEFAAGQSTAPRIATRRRLRTTPSRRRTSGRRSSRPSASRPPPSLGPTAFPAV